MQRDDVVTVELPTLGRRLTNWKSYSYNSDFLTPTDGWSFTLGDDETGDELLRDLAVGQRVTLVVNGVRQGDGYIDEVAISASRSSGTDVTISGRDLLAPVVDAILDPVVHFKAGQTLQDILRALFEPFGFSKFEVDNEANRDALSGQTRGVPMGKARVSKRGKVSGGGPLKNFVEHQLKPNPKEGTFAFAVRLTQRHGLWIWLAADNETIIVAKPNFAQMPRGQITHRRTGGNVLSGSVTRSLVEQPSCIVATGRGGGGEHERNGMRVIAINACVAADVSEILKRYRGGSTLSRWEDTRAVDLSVKGLAAAPRGVANLPWFKTTTQSVEEHQGKMFRQSLAPGVYINDPFLRPVIEKYPGAKVIIVGERSATRYLVSTARPLFLQDASSNTLAQVENYARREMALRQKKGFQVHYSVEGHAPPGGSPWTVDTMVAVEDDVLGVHEILYVQGRTFNRSRSGGTTTDLQLIRPHTLEF